MRSAGNVFPFIVTVVFSKSALKELFTSPLLSRIPALSLMLL